MTNELKMLSVVCSSEKTKGKKNDMVKRTEYEEMWLKLRTWHNGTNIDK